MFVFHQLDSHTSPNRLLAPLLRVFAALSQTLPNVMTAPLTHVIHNLITVPVSPNLRPIWLGKIAGPASLPLGAQDLANDLAGVSDLASHQTDTPNGGYAEDVDTPPAVAPRTLQTAYELLDRCLNHYLPGDIDPDDGSVRGGHSKDHDSLDDLLSPLVLLITRLCIGDDGCRHSMREWVVPVNLDRTRPLEKRSDFLGRALRLLGSVYHPRLKDAIGGMLFAMCDSDGKVLLIALHLALTATALALSLSSHVGYGNVAGFLFNKGLRNVPSASMASLTTPSGETVDPITGIVRSIPSDVDMTEEEKQREAEKLFVLFDRLEKSGALPQDQNPVRRGVQAGRLQF
jgi:hypothetical protein